MTDDLRPDEPVITYTARELLANLDRKVEEGFSGLNVRFNDVTGRVGLLEVERDQRRHRKDAVKNLVLGAGAVGGSIAAVIGALHIK